MTKSVNICTYFCFIRFVLFPTFSKVTDYSGIYILFLMHSFMYNEPF